MQKVSIVKCDSYDKDEVYNAVKKSIELIGGLNIKKGSKVLVKPNLLRPKEPKLQVSTHPSVVRAVIRILKENECTVLVGDSPGFHDPIKTAEVCGILDVCKEEGADFVAFRNKKSYLYKEGILMKRFELTDMIDKVDCIVNLPKLKTHVMMDVTLAIKNTFGLMISLNKSQMHFKLKEKKKFAAMLVDLSNFAKPCLNIMDGVYGMEGNGPANGDIKKVGIISASHDCLAMDITLTKLMGFDPLSILTNKIGLSNKDDNYLENIKIVGEKLEDVKVQFKPADKEPLTFIPNAALTKIYGNLINSRPKVDYKKCKACMECIKICPAKTISIKEHNGKKAAFINKKKCIRCFCCHEICPHDAINIKKTFLVKLMERFRTK